MLSQRVLSPSQNTDGQQVRIECAAQKQGEGRREMFDLRP